MNQCIHLLQNEVKQMQISLKHSAARGSSASCPDDILLLQSFFGVLSFRCIFNCSVKFYVGLFCCRQGSVVAHFWLVMSVPGSHIGRVTLETVTTSLEKGLKWHGETKNDEFIHLHGLVLHLASLSVRGESKMAAEGGRKCVCV